MLPKSRAQRAVYFHVVFTLPHGFILPRRSRLGTNESALAVCGPRG